MKWVVAPVVVLLALGAALWATSVWGAVPPACWALQVDSKPVPEAPLYGAQGECLRAALASTAATCEPSGSNDERTACYEAVSKRIVCVRAACPQGMVQKRAL
jgi:hypothetical protein